MDVRFDRRAVAVTGGVLVALLLVSLLVLRFRQNAVTGPAELWPGAGSWTDEQLLAMTPEDKVAQLFTAYVADEGGLSERDAARLVRTTLPGGLVLGPGASPDARLTSPDGGIPLLVTRAAPAGGEATYPPMAIAATGSADLAEAAGYVAAREARRERTDQIAAPSPVLMGTGAPSSTPVTSFSDEPERAAGMLTGYVRGIRSAGAVAAVAFVPATADPSWFSDLPVLSSPGSDPQIPLRRAIQEGVMSVIVGSPGVDDAAEDSAEAILQVDAVVAELRDDMGFQGLITADLEDMRRAQPGLGAAQGAVRLLEAGADMLIVSTDAEEARTGVLEAVQSGQLAPATVEASVRRILMTKEWLRLSADAAVSSDSAAVVSPDVVAAMIARASLTLLRNEDDLLPLTGRPRVQMVSLRDTVEAGPFANRLRAFFGDSLLAPVVLSEGAAEVSPEADVYVVPLFTPPPDSGTAFLDAAARASLDGLIAGDTPVVVVSFGSPYVINEIQAPDAYVAAYAAGAETQRAAARALVGRNGFGGRLPVSLAADYPAGDGIQREQTMIRQGFPEEVGMSRSLLSDVDSLINDAIDRRVFPGAAVAIGRAGVLTAFDGYGRYTYESNRPVTTQSLFDLASLTKVIATTTAAMKLHEQGRLDIMTPVSQFFPEFRAGDKRAVTVWNLLTHSAGLTAFRPYHTLGLQTREEVIQAIVTGDLEYQPGTRTQYSDHGMILLALIVEKITGQEFGAWTRDNIFEPLGMTRTGYRPVGQGSDPDVVPTEFDRAYRKRLMQGEVHDETAYLLGGTSGHAGLFSTAEDLSRFAFMLLNGGEANGRQFLRPETIALFTAPVQLSQETTRALGWDTKSPTGYTSAGQLFGPNSFGHTGFTGTSLWLDPDEELFVLLLTNRVYPTRQNNGISDIRPKLADIAYGAVIAEPVPVLPVRVVGDEAGR